MAALGSTPAWAAAGDSVKLSGSMRLRYEAISGQLRPGFNRDDDLFNLRTTLRADYSTGLMHLIGEIYDSRVYGGDAGTPITTGENNALEVVQGYAGVDIPNAFGDGSKLTVDAGRIMLNIASRRLIAADDYRNTTSSYTGLRGEFTARGGWHGTLIAVLPQIRLPDDREGLRAHRVRVDRESFDLMLWGGTVTHAKALGAIAVEGSFYHLAEKDRPARINRRRSLDTYGGRLFRDPAPGKWDIEIESFVQSGSIRTAAATGSPRIGVDAWFIHGDAGYTWAGNWKPRLAIEYDRASGDRPGGRYGRFDTLFGMRRADFSPGGLLASIGRANIESLGVRLEAVPGKRLDLLASYRPMWLASPTDAFATTGVRDASGRSGRFAGHEIDSRARYWLVPKRWRLEFDGTLIADGRFLRDAPNGPARDLTAYMSFNLTASF